MIAINGVASLNWNGLSSYEWNGVAGSAPITYLLKASWAIGSDTAIADEANFNTSAPGSVEDGNLYANDTGTGTVTVYANSRVQVSCSDGGYRSSGISTSRGLLLKGQLGQGSTTARYAYGWSDVSSATNLSDMMPFFYGTSNYDLSVYLYNSAGVAQFNTKYKTGSQWATTEVALLCGGYSGTLPWDGNAAGYADGWAWFYKNGSNWELIYKMPQAQTATMYLKHWNYQTQNTNNYRPRVPDADLSALLVPLVLDTFTDTSGTALTAHTPDVDVVGGGWSVVNGTWQISATGRVEQQLSANDNYHATIDTGKSDIFIEAIQRVPSSVAVMRIVCRYQDINNYWGAEIHETNNTFIIRQRASGSFTDRASASVTISTSTEYRTTVVANGQTIQAWVNDGNKISYDAATAQQTETTCGLSHYANTGYADPGWDNFAVYPIGTGGEYNNLENY